MTEPITLEQLKNASLDAEALAKAVNGGTNENVHARLGAVYPTLAKALGLISQVNLLGATSFATYSEMTASALADKSYAIVTSDASERNGLYVKQSNTWRYVGYNALEDAKRYIEDRIHSIKQLYNPSNIAIDRYVNASSNEILQASGAAAAIVPVLAGKTYSVKASNFDRYRFFIGLRADASTDVGAILGKATLVDTDDANIKTFTIPSESQARYAFINIKLRVGGFDISNDLVINEGVEIVSEEMTGLDDRALTASTLLAYDYISYQQAQTIKQLYNPSNIAIDRYVNASSNEILQASGAAAAIVPVLAGKTYSVKASNFDRYRFFIGLRADASTDVGAILGKATLVDTDDANIKTFTIPSESQARYAFINIKLRVGGFDISNDLVINEGVEIVSDSIIKLGDFLVRDQLAHEKIAQLVNSSMSSNLRNKHWVAIGDSITEKNFRTNLNYHDYIRQDVPTLKVTNMGISGSGYYNRSDVASKITALDVDIITVFFGTNDWGVSKNKPLGSFLDVTTDTISGCINTTIIGLINNFHTKKIGIFTPLPRAGNYGEVTTPNQQGYTLVQVVDLIKRYCSHYSIPCLDLYRESGLPVWSEKGNQHYFTYPNGTPDGLHPNDAGQSAIANKIRAFLETL